MKDKIKYRRQGQGRRPSHGSRKRHPPHRRDAGSTGRQWLPDPAFPAHKSTNSMTTPSRVKQSGLLSSGGLGFTIGTEKRKDQYSDADML